MIFSPSFNVKVKASKGPPVTFDDVSPFVLYHASIELEQVILGLRVGKRFPKDLSRLRKIQMNLADSSENQIHPDADHQLLQD